MVKYQKSKPIEIVGQASNKQPAKRYWGAYKGSEFYYLEVQLDSPPPLFPGHIRVVKDKLGDNADNIWDSILTSSFFGKRFIFTCSKMGGNNYTLITWREIGAEKTPEQRKREKEATSRLTPDDIQHLKETLPGWNEKISKEKKEKEIMF